MIKRLSLLSLLLLYLLAGCSLAGSPAAKKAAITSLNRDGLSSYSAIFEVQYSGPVNWIYQLSTRKSATLREENLFIEGIDKAQNPGDIRLVTDGESTWMTGAGTDNECVQFPNNQGMDPDLISPDTLLTMDELNSILAPAGEQEIAGKTALHYSGSSPAVGDWKDVTVDVYLEKTSLALLRYSIQASGDDPFFETGPGKFKARYEVTNLSEPAIEPITGCEISVPLPDTSDKFVRLPGMASFDAATAPSDMTAFYQTILPQEGWTESEAPSQAEGSTILSFTRGAEAVEIHIEAVEDGSSKVKLIFMTVQ